MPAVAPPPFVRSEIAPHPEAPSLPVTQSGCSLADYVRWFALDIQALRGRDVLDVAAGMASFTAEACARKINAVAVDPIYGATVEMLAAAIPESASIAPAAAFAESETGGGTQRFLADYDAHFIHNRYIRASLPRLPFFDGTFDVVLCANLLFPPSGRLDFDWHLAAILELVRVSAGEVRVYSFGECGGSSWAGSRLRRALRESGVESRVLTLGAEARRANAGAVLGLRKAAL